MKVAALCLLSVVFTQIVNAQIFGTNAGTYADYLPTDALNALPLRGWGNLGNLFQPDPNAQGTNGTIVADGGSVTYAQNYANGVYTLSFNSPSPVTMTMAGMFGAPTNVQRVGTLTTMNIQLTHDAGGILTGMGWFASSGISAANPVTNFAIYKPGTTPGATTPTYQNYLNGYQAVRFMNNMNVNNNIATLTASDITGPNINFGMNGPVDVVKMVNNTTSAGRVWINIPLNADATFIKAEADLVRNNLAPGKKVVVELSNEVWNAGFSQFFSTLTQGKADGRVTAGDDFGKVGQEYGLKAYSAMQTFLGEFTDKSVVEPFLGSQNTNTYFVDQAKNAIKAQFGVNAVKNTFKWQGVGVYAGDGMTGASSVTDLKNQLYADLPRVISALSTDKNDAAADGLNEAVYEWSPNGYLTRGGVPLSVINAFRADPSSMQWTIDDGNAIKNAIGLSGMMMDFTNTGDGWATQINPALAAEYERLGIQAIMPASSVPEPFSLSLIGMFGVLGLVRPKRT